ncbi:hypothetical protein WICPIJ_004215 [Wickerhamomyces pijperi]|uniref:Uncharacterized protein n=1 Tax=Wickerhamomyces pijperi TaxID=599730 RepID=A0A9P8Q8D0_WICPI|nr:hypothetical protein WICPIJ_004215 [Wickerhamomyces pijperi]
MIILTIPISFQLGGLDCGLAFTVTLFVGYSILTLIRLCFRKSVLAQLVYSSQHLFIPSLLTLFISIYSGRDQDILVNDQTFALFLKFAVGPWRVLLYNATPVFTLLEGVCTILAIQSIGKTFGWLRRTKSEIWVIISLLISGGILTTSLWFLYRIYSFDVVISSLSSSLIGVVLTISTFLGLAGIISKKGSTIESSLLFAYIVRCIYETFPELSSLASDEIWGLISMGTAQIREEIHKNDYIIPIGYILFNEKNRINLSKVFTNLTLNAPSSFQTILEFIVASSKTITPTILLNLAFRVSVFYAATRIIPTLASYTYTTSSTQQKSNTLKYLYAFAPCMVIAIYTHLMMQYSNELDSELCIWGWWEPNAELRMIVNPWLFWNWVNMFTTLGLYCAELLSEGEAVRLEESEIEGWKGQ